MSLPDKCPFCGAGVLVMAGGFECRNGRWVTFDCCTSIHAGQAERRTQSRTCEDAERARLAARVAELERDLEQAKADRARAAVDARNPLMAQLAELEARCKRLEEAGDKMADVLIWSSGVRYKQSPTASAWRKAKEAKP